MDLYNTERLSLCVTQSASVYTVISMYLRSVSREESWGNVICAHTGTNRIKTLSGSCAGFQHASGLALFLGSIERAALTWKNKEMIFWLSHNQKYRYFWHVRGGKTMRQKVCCEKGPCWDADTYSDVINILNTIWSQWSDSIGTDQYMKHNIQR